MPTIVSGILRAATRPDDEPLNILTFPTHERYETNLCRTGHNFYGWRGPGIKDWNATYAPLPQNYTLLPGGDERQLPPHVVFDLVLSQNKLGSPASQFAIAEGLSRSLHVPHVHLEHTLPHPDWGRGQVHRMRQMEADFNVFISGSSRDAWLWDDEGRVIDHGVDTELFRPDPEIHRRPVLLSVVNDWINRDWCTGFRFWKEATGGLPRFVVGDTPGLSRPAATTAELVWRYQTSAIFVNTSLVSPVPMALLEAMACGCAVVSTNTCEIPNVINDAENGYLCDTPDDMRQVCEELLDDPQKCEQIGRAARETIESRYGLKRFAFQWRSLLYQATHIIPRVREGGRPIQVNYNFGDA